MRGMSTGAKLRALVTAFVLPSRVLNRLYVPRPDADALAAVIFSSGSTGVPKGVMLTHRSVLANIDSVAQVFEVTGRDVMIGVLPFFHSFGFTGTLWFPLVSGFAVAYHPNPTEAKTIGELAGKHRATLLISTPTFCSAYVRKCEPEQFAHLRYAMVGAEKLREPVARAFKEKFGVDLLEGYGCTEMAPIVAVNVPNVVDRGERQVGVKPGTVGHPIPGVAAKIVDPLTGEGPLFDKEGLLLVSGPNRMVGYLGETERTREVMRGDWYVTGDIAVIDEAGFISITDRLSRFSKIAGEMVPHMKLEETVNAFLDDHHASAVTSVPDASKGERLIVFFTDPGRTPQELWERLCRTDLPKLWLPKREDLHFVESLPTLGTGKIDLRGLRQMAMTIAAAAEARRS
jgi:acyl-[acyl-carrier-protein]-phospholipid O-acyltransferase/long-chain-fatty-acid--[acyl-carrier-protein] ligase